MERKIKEFLLKTKGCPVGNILYGLINLLKIGDAGERVRAYDVTNNYDDPNESTVIVVNEEISPLEIAIVGKDIVLNTKV